MKIAVVGAGVFGCTAAIKLAEAGHKVTVFEREPSIMMCASNINQYRLHQGYHYPRSKETVQYVKESSILFEEEYSSAICREGYNRYYAIPHEGSLVDPTKYLNFLDSNNLSYKIIKNSPLLKSDKIALIVQVEENGFDYKELYLSISNKLSRSGALLRTNNTFSINDIRDYDIVINATYSSINNLLEEEHKIEYQYELCEKAVVRLPEPFVGNSVVVIDGEFCCVDPVGFNKNYQVIGHVREAIHDRKVGTYYEIPKDYKSLLNKGRVFSELSRFDKILNGFSEYFNVPEVTYMGSGYTVRTVLAHHDHDDARPSNIIKHDDNLYSIFSGKVGTCVDIANKLVEMI